MPSQSRHMTDLLLAVEKLFFFLKALLPCCPSASLALKHHKSNTSEANFRPHGDAWPLFQNIQVRKKEMRGKKWAATDILGGKVGDNARMIDCIVSEWSPWSKCDSTCGPGMASRNRTIRQRPQNGGKHCPSLVQKRACPGTDRDCRHGLRLLPQLQGLRMSERSRKECSIQLEREFLSGSSCSLTLTGAFCAHVSW
ncbi:conserved hypothetical protein [Culex quinquefasciatus]|uniref:Spondin-like TSP1 domain-containing protein n=1 Tax=Culex quinquefasciatus TaxID=7176 RepID=B0W0N3_CULQU|nr:conserved hypothetical protein [Culex quinquefasciatus]|eukprot:XP_001842267.1 conserved hypothetical protein [Culex quinquefasciatus]